VQQCAYTTVKVRGAVCVEAHGAGCLPHCACCPCMNEQLAAITLRTQLQAGAIEILIVSTQHCMLAAAAVAAGSSRFGNPRHVHCHASYRQVCIRKTGHVANMICGQGKASHAMMEWCIRTGCMMEWCMCTRKTRHAGYSKCA
jgi:hypothetical protein